METTETGDEAVAALKNLREKVELTILLLGVGVLFLVGVFLGEIDKWHGFELFRNEATQAGYATTDEITGKWRWKTKAEVLQSLAAEGKAEK